MKKKPQNTLHENNPLPPAPNVCVPEVFNYTDFTKLAKINFLCIIANWATEILRLQAQIKKQ
jgi:hypothetical protein